ncbi:(d)CMP kinase [Umezawaea sp. Da 62-37]|uniref:uridine kinase family protein n=1 Tax=Umezawaea sp. Da 62-37 TaxID=3075927 RepID=UPI0028F7306A|nr:(d)CMP kinase [Umezawaea sp. Da 62-37]WNV91650.1 (d)CMP kinase [Umezawaea sp. Da 62-37]
MLAAPARLGKTRVVAVDGPAGSGKSTLARALALELNAPMIKTDHFATWDDPVAWWPRLVDGVLDPLARGETGRYQRLDWTDGLPKPGRWITIEPTDVLILEGVSSARRSIAPRLSYAFWLDGPTEAERLERAVARDGQQHRQEFVNWQQWERGWFAVDNTRSRADRII